MDLCFKTFLQLLTTAGISLELLAMETLGVLFVSGDEEETAQLASPSDVFKAGEFENVRLLDTAHWARELPCTHELGDISDNQAALALLMYVICSPALLNGTPPVDAVNAHIEHWQQSQLNIFVP